jgi:hypothetical protein
VSRGGRAGFDGGRGGRGRGTDRGRGGRARGASAAHTNGSRKENVEQSVPTTDLGSWDTVTAPADAPSSSWDNVTKSAKPAKHAKPAEPAEPVEESSASWGSTAAAAASVTSSIIPDGVKKSWASMFAKPAPTPAPKAPEPVEKYAFIPQFRRNLSNTLLQACRNCET